MKKIVIWIFAVLCSIIVQSQTNYTSYFTGNSTDSLSSPAGGVCLMGGASENDNAMRWFLNRAGGGDILVLRTSGENGYNHYFYSSLGVNVNSVETIVCHNRNASYDPYVLSRVEKAEAIWFAGGDQWTYVDFWRNTPLDSLINLAVFQRNIVVGGTSAGMAILGQYYFTAKYGTVTSSVALSNPYHYKVTVDSLGFLKIPFLSGVITDTHFDNPDRRGRMTTFLARIYTDYGDEAFGIACDEYTAVCIDTNGLAYVYGAYPSYDDNAYFIRTNCELIQRGPEHCISGSPLTWNRDGMALKVYQVKGRQTGQYFFNLNDWQTGSGGIWLHWSVDNGLFSSQNGTAPYCPVASNMEIYVHKEPTILPNPVLGSATFTLVLPVNFPILSNIEVYSSVGEKVDIEILSFDDTRIQAKLRHPQSGIYIVRLNSDFPAYPFLKLMVY